jgi:hypothetical protein
MHVYTHQRTQAGAVRGHEGIPLSSAVKRA